MRLIDMVEAKEMLAAEGFPVIPSYVVNSWDELRDKAMEYSYPVVLKFVSNRYTHKSDVGGVITNIRSEEELKEALEQLEVLRNRLDPKARIVLEPMAPSGIELFAGFMRDDHFGPVMTFGIGGLFVELMGEVQFVLLPASNIDILNMCRKIRGWDKLQRGFRKFAPVDESMLVNFLQKFGEWTLAKRYVKEVDLNPVVAYANGIMVVDARISVLQQ
ncbi:MAG: acetate--CoA ligase family protein [Thermodesulforhabdaceae bacterium]|jgi:acetyltransferase